jgi:hypothetical protein
MKVSPHNLSKFFKKFVDNSISKKEYNALVEYIKATPNCPIVKSLMLEYATKHGIDKELDQEQSNLIFQHILDKINVDEINKRKGYYIKV